MYMRLNVNFSVQRRRFVLFLSSILGMCKGSARRILIERIYYYSSRGLLSEPQHARCVSIICGE